MPEKTDSPVTDNIVPMKGANRPTTGPSHQLEYDTLIVLSEDDPHAIELMVEGALRIAQHHYPAYLGDIIEKAVYATGGVKRLLGQTQETARGWFRRKIINDLRSVPKEQRDKTLGGASGTWVHEAWFTDPIRTETPTDLGRLLGQTAAGLLDARNQNSADLEELFTVLLTGGKVRGTFANRLHHRGDLEKQPWLEKVAIRGKKEWGVALPTNGDGLVARSATDMQTIAIRLTDVRFGQEPQKRTLWLSVPQGEAYDSDQLGSAITDFLTSQEIERGIPTTHPLFAIAVAPLDQDMANALDLEDTANKAPVVRVVLERDSAKTIDKMSLCYPHLTANENHGRQIVDFLLKRLGVKLRIPEEELTRPRILSRRYDHKRKISVRNVLGRKTTTRLKVLEGVAGFEISAAERQLLELAQASGGSAMPFTAGEGMAQSLISEGSVYICIEPNPDERDPKMTHELQIGLMPSGKLQDLKQAFRILVDRLPGLNPHRLPASNIRNKLIDWLAHDRELSEAFPKFAPNVGDMISFVKAEINRGKKARGVLAVLDTYIPTVFKRLIKIGFAEQSRLFEAGSAQISSVYHGLKDPLIFISALASYVRTTIGNLTWKEIDGRKRKLVTVRYRAEEDELKDMLEKSTASSEEADIFLDQAVLDETRRRTQALRQNMAILNLLVVVADNPDQVLSPTGEPHEVFTRFTEAWAHIAAASRPQ